MRRAGLVAALASGVVGLATGQPGFLLLGIVPLGYALYGELSGRPDPELSVRRGVSPREPYPGEDVMVTLTVTNTGDRPLADVRVADRPPEGVPASGETALAAALRPGETAECSYALSPSRGTHEFDDPVVRPRSLAGVQSEQRAVEAAGDDAVVCQTLLDEVSLPDRTIRYVGRTPTDSGGAGVEFYATREYRRGDPLSRINWSHYARTGELSTVELREERALTVVFLVDDRPAAQRTARGYGPDSLDLAAYAVSRALPALLDENHRVGMARATSLGDGDVVDPGAGPSTRAAVEDALGAARARTHGAGDGAATDGGVTSRHATAGERDGYATAGERDGYATAGETTETEVTGETVGRSLAARLPPGAQVVCCTPLSDGFATELTGVVRSAGYAVTVLSPDLPGRSPDDTPGRTLARAERTERTRELERRGVPVVDWNLDDPLALVLSRTFETWEGVR